ncbi:hypothetical protein QQF45_17545 [Halopseudomonas aestusnigri]|uniref:hypothetical protein n=1 Tax=Halopseudomonas aestusnigri TaxID=857252 RepID=UPI0025526AF9|nr:hypothetical protein [Halopseudomonas aestusnigri]MDL2200849.1 hypothetical protein [Halopseudomonas aestusnigri]
MAKSNSNVFSFTPGSGAGSNNGGGDPPGDDMEARVKALEVAIPDIRERLVRVETKLDSVEKHGATKADLATMESTLIKWFVGTAFAMVGLASAIAFGLARYLS